MEICQNISPLNKFVSVFALQYARTGTERPCPTVRAPDSHSGWSGFKYWPGDYLEVCHNFSQSLQENSGIVSQIRSQPLPSTSFPIRYSLIILPYVAWVIEGIFRYTINK
jgi:hypothetical protein